MANNRNRTAPAATRQASVRAGDATGRANEALQREHAKEIAAAAKTTTLVNPPANMVEDSGTVTDYSDPLRPIEVPIEDVLAAGDTAVGEYDLPDNRIDMDSLPTGQVEPGFVAPQLPKDEPEAAHQRPLVQDPAPLDIPVEAQHTAPLEEPRLTREEWAALEAQRYEREAREPVRQQPQPRIVAKMVIMRVNTDLEDVTFGAGTNYSFEAGKPYKVPEALRDHLKERGYVNY